MSTTLFFECGQFWSHRYSIKNWFAVASSDAADLLLLSLKSCRQELTVKSTPTFSTQHQRQKVALLDSELLFSKEHFLTGFTCILLQYIHCSSDVLILWRCPSCSEHQRFNLYHTQLFLSSFLQSRVLIIFNKTHMIFLLLKQVKQTSVSTHGAQLPTVNQGLPAAFIHLF